MHFYVFTYYAGDPTPVYERTCGHLKAATDWLTTYRGRGRVGFVSINCLPVNFYY